MSEPVPASTRRALVVTVGAAAVPLVVAVGLGVLLGTPVAGLVVGVALALAVVWHLRSRGAERVLAAMGAHAIGDDQQPRLRNLVEGLCLTAGLPEPELYLIDSEHPDAAAVGLGPRRAALVVTTGLLDTLDRVQLEGVVAHQIVRIRRGDATAATVAAALGPAAPLVAGWLAPPELVTGADLEACQLTRYPPGLAGALEKLASGPSGMTPFAGPGRAHLWLAPVGGDRSHPPLAERIQLLREL